MLEEYAASLRAGLAFVAAANLLLAQMRAAAPFEDYAFAGERLVGLAARYAVGAEAAFARRVAWTEAALRQGVCARSYMSLQATSLFVNEEAEIQAVVQVAARDAGRDALQPQQQPLLSV